MVTVGVDVSTSKLAVVALTETLDLVSAEEVVGHGKLATNRFDELTFWFREHIETLDQEHGLSLVAIEGVPFVRSRQGSLALAQGLGAARAVCVVLGIPHSVVAGHDWKKRLDLSGNANKSTIAEWALAHGASHEWSQDLLDAFSLAYSEVIGA